MSEIVVLPFAPEADVERFRKALAALLEERAGDDMTHRVTVARPGEPIFAMNADPNRVVVVAVEASADGLRDLWRAGLDRPGAASDARGFVIVHRASSSVGEADPAQAVPITLTQLLNRPSPDPAWRLADVSVSTSLAAAAAHADGPVYALREADGLDAPTTREAAALEGHYRALVDRLFPAARRRPVARRAPAAAATYIERQLLLRTETGALQRVEPGDTFGIAVLAAPSGAGKSFFVCEFAERHGLPVVSLSTVSATEHVAKRLAAATVVDGRLRCLIDDFEACTAWLGHLKQAAFAEELVEALRETRRTRGVVGFEILLALRPSEHVATLSNALSTLATVSHLTLAPLESGQAQDFARTHVGDDAGILLRRLDDIGVTAHLEDLRFFRDLCSLWRAEPDRFTADPVAVMGFGLDQRLAPLDTEDNARLTAPERRRVAAPFAFAATLTDRLQLARNGAPPDPSSLTETDLHRLAGITREDLQDTLRAAPIFDRTSEGTGFRHESDREFLAAEHMEGLPTRLVERWMVVGEGEHGRVPFSLRAVARWLLLRAPLERVEWLLRVEPTLVIEALPWLRPEVHAPAVDALLAAHRAGRFPIWEAERRLTDDFAVQGPGVRELLCTQLRDPDPLVRRFAARALSHLRDPSTAALLAARALETTEVVDVRVAAAAGVLRLGDDAATRRLEPLLDLTRAEDPEMELRGLALLALWPRHIDAQRFFGAMGPGPRAGFFGSYKLVFMSANSLLAGLKLTDFTIALPWARARLSRPEFTGLQFGEDVEAVRGFAVEVILRAFVLIDVPEVHAMVVELWCSLLDDDRVLHDPAWRNITSRVDVTAVRREVAAAYIDRDSSDTNPFSLYSKQFLGSEDIEWVIEKARASVGAKNPWTELAAMLWAPAFRPDLYESMRNLPGISGIGRVDGGRVKIDWTSGKCSDLSLEPPRRRPPTEPAPDPREKPGAVVSVSAALSESVSTPGRAWQQVHLRALCRNDSHRLFKGSVDAFKLPGSPELQSADAELLLDSAIEFAKGATPEADRWRRERDRTDVDCHATRAFGTLAIHAPDRLRALGPALLGPWAPLALDGFPPEDRGPWLRLLWTEAPTALRDALQQFARNARLGGSVRRALLGLDRTAAVDLAFELLDGGTTADAVCEEVLSLLFSLHEPARARAWAVAHLDRDGVELALVCHDPEPVHLHRLISNGRAEHAAQLLARSYDRFGTTSGRLPTLGKLSPGERAILIDALIASSRTLPRSGILAPSEIMRRALPEALIRGLVDAGEVEALTDLASRRPELQPEAERARVQRAQRNWRPPTLDDLIAGIRSTSCAAEPPATDSPRPAMGRSESMEYLFTWLHVSDLHFGQGGPDYEDNRELVLGALRESLVDLGRPGAPPKPDAILVTGDTAFSGGGRGDEYGRALTWFGATAETVGLGLGDVYTVPGNHDVDRDVGKSDPDVADTLAKYRGETALGGIWGPHHEKQLARLQARQQKYLDFAAQLAPGTAELFWQKRVPARRGLKVRLLGLNSSLLAADEKDAGHLEIGDRQRRMLLEPPPEPGEVLIALQHHPVGLAGPHWLKTHDASEHGNWLASRTAIALYGHVHDQELQTVHGGGADRPHYRLVAGASHDERSVPKRLVRHAYSVAAIGVDADGALCLEVWPRVWSPRNTDFRLDTDNVPKGKSSTLRPLNVEGWVHAPLAVATPLPPALAAAAGQARLAGTALTDFLIEAAQRWPREADARRLAATAALPIHLIDFSGEAQARWLAVYEESLKSPDGLKRLLSALVADI